MKRTQTKWNIPDKVPGEISENMKAYSQVFRQILYNRGLTSHTEAEAFLKAEMPSFSGQKLLGIDTAVEHIDAALKANKKIAVYGDYDADGVTATALMLQILTALGADVQPYIPNRFTEGYGLNTTALDKLKQDGVELVITVDCGIRAVEQAKYARQIGLDLIITDHHTTGSELPECTALINPKRPDDPYPEKILAGVGVAYKLAVALIEALKPKNIEPDDLIDLVAIGTVADLVPMISENRSLVQRGLRMMRTPRRQGLASLMGVIGVSAATISAADIGYGLGPRINAAGRIGSAQDALRLLTTTDLFEAGQYAQVLDNRNRERQRITREIQEQAETLAKPDKKDAMLLFAHHPDFNPGVVGLAASRLVEQYYRPSVVGFRNEEYTRASCRSIPEFHITQALEECADLLTQYGGHAAAAGFTVPNKNLQALEDRLQALAKEQLSSEDLSPTVDIDAVAGFSDLKPSLLKEMARLEPTGKKNRSAVFASRNVYVNGARTVGKDGSHLKLILSSEGITFDAIAFRFGHLVDDIPGQIHVAYAFELNEFNGRQTLQLNIKDIQY